MKEPAFWSRPRDWRSLLLTPLGMLYGWATARRIANGSPTRLELPVVCVGNLHAGGTGKTPTTIALVQILRDLGHVPHVVSRGYGGTLIGPVAVEPAKHTAAQVGDEPLLMSAFADVWVARDRALGGQAAQSAGATIVVLDDGFQNPSLHKDLALVVVDAERGFGNGRCLPAGPLREPVAQGLKRADAVISIGTPTAQSSFSLPPAGSPTRFDAELVPLETGMDWSGTPYLAFAGIGRPEKFFQTLRHLGATIYRTESLADHEPLTSTLLARLDNDARSHGAQLVTTEKDAARLPPSWRGQILTVPVRLTFENEGAIIDLLKTLPKP